MAKRWRTLRLWSTLGLVVWVLAYALPAPASRADITYQLDWAWGEAQALPNGGWQIQTPLGYQVIVQEGFLVSYSGEAVACEHSHAWGFVQWLWAWARGNVVEAGHGETPNEARSESPLLEDLQHPAMQELGGATGTEPSYCQLHYLLARATPDTRQQTSTAIGKSLYLAGTYQHETAFQVTPFVIEAHFADGIVAPMLFTGSEQLAQATPFSGQIVVSITRNLDGLFAQVDFDTMSAQEQARAALRGLLATVRVDVIGGLALPQ